MHAPLIEFCSLVVPLSIVVLLHLDAELPRLKEPLHVLIRHARVSAVPVDRPDQVDVAHEDVSIPERGIVSRAAAWPAFFIGRHFQHLAFLVAVQAGWWVG